MGIFHIRGSPSIIGIRLGRTRGTRILACNGVDPDPQRPIRWADFLRSHFGHLRADVHSSIAELLKGVSELGEAVASIVRSVSPAVVPGMESPRAALEAERRVQRGWPR